jgi:hypothetical protein
LIQTQVSSASRFGNFLSIGEGALLIWPWLIVSLLKVRGVIMFGQMQTFPCPNCREIINDSMEVCPFCSVPVDKDIAAMMAERQRKVNQACSDASFLKSSAIALYGLLLISLIPLLGLVFWGFLVTLVIVLVLLIRWQIRTAGVVTNDPDFASAKRSWIIALVLWIFAIPFAIILLIFSAVITAIISSLVSGR